MDGVAGDRDAVFLASDDNTRGLNAGDVVGG